MFINDYSNDKQSTVDFNQCQYKTKERGRSNKQPYTLSDPVPEPPDDIRVGIERFL